MVLLNSNLGVPPVPVVSSLQSNRVSKSLQTRLQTAFLFFSFSCTYKSSGLMAIGELNQGCIVNAYQMDCLLFGIQNEGLHVMHSRNGLPCVLSGLRTHIPAFQSHHFGLAGHISSFKELFPWLCLFSRCQGKCVCLSGQWITTKWYDVVLEKRNDAPYDVGH